MSDHETQMQGTEATTDPRLPGVHATMAKEADGFYALVSAICSAFLGGAVIFSERFLANSPVLSRAALVTGIAGLTLCLTLLCWVRWGNVESFRMYAEALRDQDTKLYDRVRARGAVERRKTRVALWSFSAGMVALALFAAERIFSHDS